LNKFNAVTRKYVDYYVDDIKKLLPDTTQGGTVDDYIVRTAGASKDKRTMVDYLILPSEFKDTVGLELKDDFTDDHYAVSKRYVDANIKDIPKLPKPLKANSVLHIKNDGTTIEWDDTEYLKLSGGTMGGVLSLIDDDYDTSLKKYTSTDNTIAASRAYVDNYVKDAIILGKGDVYNWVTIGGITILNGYYDIDGNNTNIDGYIPISFPSDCNFDKFSYTVSINSMFEIPKLTYHAFNKLDTGFKISIYYISANSFVGGSGTDLSRKYDHYLDNINNYSWGDLFNPDTDLRGPSFFDKIAYTVIGKKL
jgi:hypothetical protein